MDPSFKYYTCCREVEMIPYAYCYLNELYPKREGWKMNFMRDDVVPCPDFVIDKITGKCTYRVVVAVHLESIIGKGHISEMKVFERVMRSNRKYHIEKIFIVPTGCDISIVPRDIRIIFLKEFSLKSA